MERIQEDEDLMALYQEIILDHGRSPRNFGTIEHASCESEGRNPLCGDRITVTVDISGEKISNVGIDGKGCAISIASASMMSEAIKGLSKSEVAPLFHAVQELCTKDLSVDAIINDIDTQISERLEKLMALSGVRRFPVRVKCATLPWHALMSCLAGKKTATTEA